MKRPLAYITAAWGGNGYGKPEDASELAAQYCRKAYEAGYSPLCPALLYPAFLQDRVPKEHQDALEMAGDLLRRARVLVVCGDRIDETVKNDIALAERLRITATTLDGILAVHSQGCGKGNPHRG